MYLLTNSYVPCPVWNKIELNLKEADLFGFYFIYLKYKKKNSLYSELTENCLMQTTYRFSDSNKGYK